MKVGELKENILDEFLNKNKHSIFHTPTYKKFIEEAFDCEYQILGYVDDGSSEIIINREVKTILPIVEIKSKLLGNKIISSAFLEYGGFSGSEEGVNEILSFLEENYQDDFNYLEIRGGDDGFDNILSAKLIKKDLYKRFTLKLSSKEEMWYKIQKSKRKAIKRGLRLLKVKEIPIDDLNKFYQLYCKNMRSFGSPCYSKKYFRSFYKNIVDNKLGKIYGAYLHDKLISALLGFYYQDRVHILIAVSDSKFKEYRPNDAVHWKFIEWACENNYSVFDFGRVREDSGQFEYKRKWGPELKDLPSYFLLWKAKEIPIVDPSRNELATKVWKRMPLGLTKIVGHRLRKGLGI